MATLTYDPTTGDFLNGTVVQTPGTSDTVVFGANGGTAYTYTVPVDFPDVAEIEITSGDATVVVPGGETLNAGTIAIGAASGDANRATASAVANGDTSSVPTLVLGASGGAPPATTSVNTDLLIMQNDGSVIINPNAAFDGESYDFNAPASTPFQQYGVTIANGAFLFLGAPPGSAAVLDFSGAPSSPFIDTNTTGVLQIGNVTETPAQFVRVVSSVFGSRPIISVATVTGAGLTFDSNLLPQPVDFTSQTVSLGTSDVVQTASFVDCQIIPSIKFVPGGVVLNGCTILSSLTLTPGQSIGIENGLFGATGLTAEDGTVINYSNDGFDGVAFAFLNSPLTPPTNGHVVVSAADPDNLFGAEFVTTTFGPSSPITVTGDTEFDATGGTIVLDDQTQVSDATAQFNGTLSLDAGGRLSALDAASVTVQTDIVNDGLLYLAGASSLLFQSSSVTGSGTMQFSGAGNDVSFDGIGVTATLFDFADGDGIDIGSNFGGNSDFGTNSTTELSGNVLDVLNNDSAVIAAFTLNSTDGFSYKQSDFFVNSDDNGGTVLFTSGVSDVVCFVAGTHILTPHGEVLVETLRPGDFVITVSGAQRKLRWVGCGRTLVTPRNRDRATPVVVRRDALAQNVPHRDLYITRGHSLFLESVLIPVEELVNHRSIAWVEEAKVVEFYHLELDSHEVVIAEGAAAESFREDGNGALFHNAAARPATAPMAPYASVLHDHPTVKRIWRQLSDRAGPHVLPLTDDADLHLLADGVRLDAESNNEKVWRFRLRGPVSHLNIVSRSAIPSMLGLAQDQRRLGVALRRIVLAWPGERVSVGWDADCLVSGFHAPEPLERHRWTNGEAALPPSLLPQVRAGARVELHVSGLLPYPVAPAAEQRRSMAA